MEKKLLLILVLIFSFKAHASDFHFKVNLIQRMASYTLEDPKLISNSQKSVSKSGDFSQIELGLGIENVYIPKRSISLNLSLPLMNSEDNMNVFMVDVKHRWYLKQAYPVSFNEDETVFIENRKMDMFFSGVISYAQLSTPQVEGNNIVKKTNVLYFVGAEIGLYYYFDQIRLEPSLLISTGLQSSKVSYRDFRLMGSMDF